MAEHLSAHEWAGICLAPGCSFGHDVLSVNERQRLAREWLAQPAPADAAALAAALESQHVFLSGPAHGPKGAIRSSGACDICRLIVGAALPVYPPAPPAIDAAHLARQREWSEATFGPGPRTGGVLDHIRKELREIEAEPLSLEWIDVVILALDGAWRAGHEPQAIIDAIRAKQARNEARTWPDWRLASPDQAIEHDRPGEASPAPLPLDVERRLAEAERTIEAMSGDAADLTDLIGEAAAMRTVLGHLLGDDWGRIHDSGCATCDAGRALLSAEHELPSHAARIARLATPEPTEDGQP